MLNIIGKKNWYFIFSLLIIIPGVISLFLWGLNLSIDFTGGTRMILIHPDSSKIQTQNIIRNAFGEQSVDIVTLQPSEKSIVIRTRQINEKQNTALISDIKKDLPDIKQESFETIGPAVGGETTQNALKALALASLLIVLYIAWSFRSVPKPTSSWKFGICAIITLLHDILVLVGIFSLLGHFYGVEIDSLFITALLTVIGFSVHDTIVVFDRIRENLRKSVGLPFEQIVNDSILQTIVRSLNTSFTTMLVLFTLLIFGGDSLRWFIAALLIGIGVGTYSSIFNAAPLLVLWHQFDRRRKNIK